MAAGGMGRNAIARELGVAAATVTRAAELGGVSFDRSATAVATQVVVLDAKAERARIARRLLGVANTFIDSAESAEDGREARDYMAAAGLAVDRHLRIDTHDANDGRALSAFDEFVRVFLGRDSAPDADGGKLTAAEVTVDHIDDL